MCCIEAKFHTEVKCKGMTCTKSVRKISSIKMLNKHDNLPNVADHLKKTIFS